jgi:hypothetical protein
VWAEFNYPGMPSLDIRLDRNQATAAECHGLGMVDVSRQAGLIMGRNVVRRATVRPLDMDARTVSGENIEAPT